MQVNRWILPLSAALVTGLLSALLAPPLRAVRADTATLQTDTAAPAAPAAVADVPAEAIVREPEIFELDTRDGFAIIKQLPIGGGSMKALVDTGVLDLTLPQPVFDSIDVLDRDTEEVLDFAGSSRRYNYGFARLPAPGSGRIRSYEVSVGDPRDLGIADGIVPLDLFDSDVILFAMSRAQLVLFELEAGDEEAETVRAETGAGHLKIIPYWRNPEGYFVALRVGEDYYFALLDTGAQYSAFNDHFIQRYPQYFEATDYVAETSGVHGGSYQQELFNLRPGIALLGVDDSNDLDLAGEMAADQTLNYDGEAAAAEALGGFSSAYKHKGGLPFPPVANIGMDVLAGKYDFMFDTRQHYLVIWPKEETDKLFPRE